MLRDYRKHEICKHFQCPFLHLSVSVVRPFMAAKKRLISSSEDQMYMFGAGLGDIAGKTGLN